MGQYYMTFIEIDNKTTVYDRTVDGQYNGAKLMEHSWLLNPFVQSISKLIFKHPARIVWCGDYANDDEKHNALKEKTGIDFCMAVWGDEGYSSEGIKKDCLELNDKYLINHTSKEFIDCNKYIERCTMKDGWCIHPLPLLTALGNGQGGGDYRGINEDIVGAWAYQLISIDDVIPENYIEIDIESVTFLEED